MHIPRFPVKSSPLSYYWQACNFFLFPEFLEQMGPKEKYAQTALIAKVVNIAMENCEAGMWTIELDWKKQVEQVPHGNEYERDQRFEVFTK